MLQREGTYPVETTPFARSNGYFPAVSAISR